MTDSLAGLPTIWVIGFLGLLGLLIGSFLNVVVYRVPNGISIAHPPSACPGCGETIQARDNVPVLSWLVLRGRCRTCGGTISLRYPLVELGTALAFIGVTIWVVVALGSSSVRFSGSIVGGALFLVAYLYLAAITVALALIDLDTKKLPNKIVLPSYLVGGVLLAVSAVLTGDLGAFGRALIGMAALWGFYFLLSVFSRGGMGYGDVKLAGVLGLYLGYLGWSELIVGAFAAFLLGGLFSIGLLVARRVGRKSGIPFGPWMLAGAWVGILFGAPIAGSYLYLIGAA